VTLKLRHEFAAPLDATLGSLASADYAEQLAAEHPFFAEVSVLSLRITSAYVERKLRYRARPFIAKLGPFSPAPDWFVWIEHSRLDRARACLTFDNVPVLERVRRTFHCRGSMQFDVSPDGFGTTREARFDLGFQVPALYRPLSELALSMVRRQLAHTLDAEAGLLNRWLGATPDAALALDLRLTA
jgi:hypothetical protein